MTRQYHKRRLHTIHTRMEGFKQFINESANQSQEHDILGMYRDNYRYQVRQISELTGVSIAGIYRVLEKYGIKPGRRRREEEHGLIKQYHHTGIPVNRISELTGYSQRQIYNVIRSNNVDLQS